MGFEGWYIYFVDFYDLLDELNWFIGLIFKIVNGLDLSLWDMVDCMFRIVIYYFVVEVFVDIMGKEEFGIVVYVLCVVICKFLKDYFIFIV